MRFALYLAVGLVAWLVDLSVYHVMWPIAGIAIGQLFARIAGAGTAFLLNRWKTFNSAGNLASLGPQAFKYILLLVLNWAVSIGLIYILSYRVGVHPLKAKVLVDIIIVPGNYVFMKYWVFKSTTIGPWK